MEDTDTMRKMMILVLVLCLGFLPVFAQPAVSAETGTVTIQPEELNIGTFFSGGDISISGEVPEGQDMFVEIIGPAANGQFDIKGRFGPFWMTRDKAELNGAPSMYILLLPGEGQDPQQIASSLGLGLNKLREKVSIESPTLQPDDIFKMFLDLKQKEGLYIEKKTL